MPYNYFCCVFTAPLSFSPLFFTFPLDFPHFVRILLTIFTCAVYFCGDIHPWNVKARQCFFFLFQMTSGASYSLVAMKILDCKWAQIMSLWSNYIHYSENKVHIIDPMVKGGCKKARFSPVTRTFCLIFTFIFIFQRSCYKPLLFQMFSKLHLCPNSQMKHLIENEESQFKK